MLPPGKTFLKNRSANPFERNMTDEFEITMRPLGRLTELLVGHDDTGFGAAWHLEYIEVTDTLMGVVSACAWGAYLTRIALPTTVTRVVRACVRGVPTPQTCGTAMRQRMLISPFVCPACHSPTQTWWFECNAWLSSTEDDRCLERLLKASLEDPAKKKTQYKVRSVARTQ